MIDLLPYLYGNAGTFLLANNWGEGEIIWCETNGSEWFHVKNRNWEQFFLLPDGDIARGVDTSHGDHTLYINHTGPHWGAKWLLRKMAVGQTIQIAPEVTFHLKATGETPPGYPVRYTHYAWLKLVKHHATWDTGFGMVLSDVIELEGGPSHGGVDERYWYWNGILAGWEKINPAMRSGLSHPLPDNERKQRESYPWLVIPHIPEVEVDMPTLPNDPIYPGPGWREVAVRSTHAATIVRARPTTNSAVIASIPGNQDTPVTLHDAVHEFADNNTWSAIRWGNATRWVARNYLIVPEPEPEPELEPEPDLPTGTTYTFPYHPKELVLFDESDADNFVSWMEGMAHAARQFRTDPDWQQPAPPWPTNPPDDEEDEEGQGGEAEWRLLRDFSGARYSRTHTFGEDRVAVVELPEGWVDEQNLRGDEGQVIYRDIYWTDTARPEPGFAVSVDSVSGTIDVRTPVDVDAQQVRIEAQFWSDAQVADGQPSDAKRDAFLFIVYEDESVDHFTFESVPLEPKDFRQHIGTTFAVPEGKRVKWAGLGFNMHFAAFRGHFIVKDVRVYGR